MQNAVRNKAKTTTL